MITLVSLGYFTTQKCQASRCYAYAPDLPIIAIDTEALE